MTTEYKKEARGDTYDSHCPDDPTANGSRSRFCPFLQTVPFLVSALLFDSVLVRSGLGFIVLLQSSCLQKFMLGQSCAPVSSFPLRVASSRSFHEREGARPLIVSLVFYVSNLSWNTNDDTLRNVRLIIFFGSACVITFLILGSLSRNVVINDIKAFGQYGNIVDVRLCLLSRTLNENDEDPCGYFNLATFFSFP